MRFRTEFAVWAVLLVALAANPVWFFPHAEEPTREYRAVEITDDNRYRQLWDHPRVIDCQSIESRACALEFRLRNGTYRIGDDDAHLMYSRRPAYDFVIFQSGFYAVVSDDRGDELAFGLRPTTQEAAVEGVATSYEHASADAKRAVRTGSVTLHGELYDHERIVGRDGTYYAIQRVSTRTNPLHGWVPRFRWLLWLGTVPWSMAAMFRWS